MPGRALGLTATTLGARGEVQQSIPGKVLHIADTQRGFFIEVLDRRKVDWLAVDHDRLQCSESWLSRRLPHEPDVRPDGEPMPSYAHRGVESDDNEPRH